MLFNSPEFLFFFLPVVFFVYFWLKSRGGGDASKLFLIAASLFFYSWWNPVYLPLLLGSMAFNFTLGKVLVDAGSNGPGMARRGYLILGVAGNLGLLGYFKYSDFFIRNFNLLSGGEHGLLGLALPLAISFFTFQQIAYLVDSYQSKAHEYNLLNYALFVSFFPQLIAGPIVHHKEMMPQFYSATNQGRNYDNIASGLFILSIGLFKKVAIADSFAAWASPGFDVATSLTALEAWVTSLSYTFQLYFDFSGYSDMAIGIALLFNIRLPLNFNSPYKATGIQDFWRRWHMTLSRFLRDYLYIPLGGNKHGNLRLYVNLMITFILGGLWHGAGWNFVFWGFLHGLALVIQRLWRLCRITISPLLGWFITFQFVNVAWVFFRATSWQDAIKVLEGMVGINGLGEVGSLPESSLTFVWIGAALAVVSLLPNSQQVIDFPAFQRKKRYSLSLASALGILLAFSTVLMLMTRHSEFIYFNF